MMAHPWHHWELERVFAEIQSQPIGLSYLETRQRLRQRKKSTFQKFLLSVLVVIVLVFFVIIFNTSLHLPKFVKNWHIFWLLTILGFHGAIDRGLHFWIWQTDRQKHLREVIVRRDNRYVRVPDRNVVEGDIVWLNAKHAVPGNVRLVAVKDLQVGESTAGKWQITVKDTIAPLPNPTPRSEQSNMVYAGAEVVSGEGLGIVVNSPYTLQKKYDFIKLPSLLHQEIFQLFQVTIGIMIVLNIVVFFSRQDFLSIFMAFLAITATAFHGLQMATIAQQQCQKMLQAKNISLRFPALVDTISRLDTIILQLNSYFSVNLPEINIAWRGILHGTAEEAAEIADQVQIPVQSYIPGLALPTSAAIGICCQTEEDIPLITKASLVIASQSSVPAVQSSAGVLLPDNNIDNIVQVVELARVSTDQAKRLTLGLFSSILSLTILVILTTIGQQKLLPWQIFWSGSVVPCLFSIVFLQEPPPSKILETQFSGLFHKNFYQPLLLNIVLMVLMVSIAFYAKRESTDMSLTIAWTTLTFSQIGTACSLVRLPLLRLPWLLMAISVVIVGQIIFLQSPVSAWIGSTPIDIVGWLIAVLMGSIIFWVNEFLRPILQTPNSIFVNTGFKS